MSPGAVLVIAQKGRPENCPRMPESAAEVRQPMGKDSPWGQRQDQVTARARGVDVGRMIEYEAQNCRHEILQ